MNSINEKQPVANDEKAVWNKLSDDDRAEVENIVADAVGRCVSDGTFLPGEISPQEQKRLAVKLLAVVDKVVRVQRAESARETSL